jgi:hypothetical protein
MIRERVALAILIVAVANTAAFAAVSSEALKQTDIVFVGKVVEPEQRPGVDLPPGTKSVAAEVEQIIDKPPAVVLRKGDRVTIAVSDPAAYAAGTRHMFYTAGWIFADSLAVREIAHEPMPPPGVFADAAPQVQQRLRDAKLQASLDKADAVVVGTVKSLTNVEDTDHKPVSEHDPQWQDAVIEVGNWLKGAPGGVKSVIVRFPASRDVAWYHVPKLKTGSKRTLLLHQDVTTGPKAMLRTAPSAPRFMLIAADDEQPAEDAPHVRSLMKH